MRASFRVEFTINGKPFHVRRDRIIAVGTGYMPDPTWEPEPVERGEVEPQQPMVEVTMLSIDGMQGNLPVDESLADALIVWDGLIRRDQLGVGDFER